MAKQVGPLFFTGTIDGIIFYKVGEQYYTRSKGSYKSAKHMRRNPKYQRTMENADQFGNASKLVQAVYYKYVPKQHRKQGVYGKLTGMVYGWLKEGKSREEAKEALLAYCQTQCTSMDQKTTNIKQRSTTTVQQPIEQRSTNNGQRPTRTDQRPKQARYLSRWKVKQSGRLKVPSSDACSLSMLSADAPFNRLRMWSSA
jgi:hypothetical protein